MNAKMSLFVICVEEIIHLLLYNLHGWNFKVNEDQQMFSRGLANTQQPHSLVCIKNFTLSES